MFGAGSSQLLQTVHVQTRQIIFVQSVVILHSASQDLLDCLCSRSDQETLKMSFGKRKHGRGPATPPFVPLPHSKNIKISYQNQLCVCKAQFTKQIYMHEKAVRNKRCLWSLSLKKLYGVGRKCQQSTLCFSGPAEIEKVTNSGDNYVMYVMRSNGRGDLLAAQ